MNIDFTSINISCSLIDALDVLLDKKISGVSVVDENNIFLGYISIDDFLFREEMETININRKWINIFFSITKRADNYIRQHAFYVSELISRSDVYVREDADIAQMIKMMKQESISELPVVELGKIVGIVNKSDILEFLRSSLKRRTESVDDKEIYNSIRSQFFDQAWSDGISFEVKNGIVTVSGAIINSDIRKAAHVAIENIIGVKDIIDNMTILNPEMPL
ncbi:CBS domain-containing protein [Brucella gallinifaecis]|uniref:CBS domain-containing protein n=1 Tax=Brucella gallinifaecis TaxID=215590 RepID=UPI0023624C50|nr:CBS domain-containing protein [Brucella gallinifaecis]